MGIRGKLCIDPMMWARVFFKYLPNQKITSTAKQLGLEFDKWINYRQQEELQLVSNVKDSKHFSKEIMNLSKDTIELIADYLKKDFSKLKLKKMKDLDKVCGDILLKYVAEDTDVLLEIVRSKQFQESVEDYSFMSEIFNIEFVKLMHLPTSLNEFQERLFFTNMGTYHEVVCPVNLDRIKKFYDRSKKYFNSSREENYADRCNYPCQV